MWMGTIGLQGLLSRARLAGPISGAGTAVLRPLFPMRSGRSVPVPWRSGRGGRRPAAPPDTSFHSCTSLAPCLISRFGPQLILEVILPGTAKTSRCCSSAILAVIDEPLYCAPSTTRTPTLMPLMIRLRIGKVLRIGRRAHREFREQQPFFGDLARQLAILGRVDQIDPAAKNRDRVAAYVESRCDAPRCRFRAPCH